MKKYKELQIGDWFVDENETLHLKAFKSNYRPDTEMFHVSVGDETLVTQVDVEIITKEHCNNCEGKDFIRHNVEPAKDCPICQQDEARTT